MSRHLATAIQKLGNTHMLRIAVVFIVSLLSIASSVHAWGGEGHQVVAWIAEERLTERAKAGVKELLGDANLSDGEIANWADQVRRERRESAPWHYVNIPIDSKGYDAKRDGHGGDNIIDAVTRFRAVLADRTAPKDKRVEALKFLVHFVGDLHQPLHCADRNGDKGGNKTLVFFPGQRKAVSLHSVWDSAVLRASKGRRSVADYGSGLNGQISVTQAAAWSKGESEQWAVESWKIARDVVYAGVPTDGPPLMLDNAYLSRAKPVVDEQLERAGVRLAAMLNALFVK